jgi:hypothetical protein
MKRSSAGIYNFLTGLFVILTLISCGWIAGVYSKILAPPAIFSRAAVVVPTVLIPPTDTPTFTPSATFTPSLTFTPTPTTTATDTPTLVPTDTPVPSNTPLPSNTPIPSNTSVPSNTPKGAPTVAGTAGTPSLGNADIAFAPDAVSPQYTANPDPTTACKVEVIAGQILDLNNQPITSKVEVFIFGPSNYKKLAKPVSANVPPFGVGYWVLVIPQFNSNAYTAEVLNSQGIQISTPVDVQFTADCQKNVALVTFTQVKQTTLP